MEGFKDLNNFLVVKPIVLPIDGKSYTFPGQIPARLWLQLQELQAIGSAVAAGVEYDPDKEVLSDMDQSNMMLELMGDSYKAMLDDGVTSTQLQVVFRTLFAWHTNSPEYARMIWEEVGETPAPNRATRRSRPKKKAGQTGKSPVRGSRGGSKGPKSQVSESPGEAS